MVDTLDEAVANPKPRRRWWVRLLKRIGQGLLIAIVVLAGWLSWLHYQATKKLDEALAELDRADPGWRWADIEAARATIPDDENSARVVVASTQLLPKQWPTRDLDTDLAPLGPEEQIRPDDFARMKDELAKAKSALEEAYKLADLPRGRHRVIPKRNPLGTLLPDHQEVRRVTQLLHYDILRRAQDGDMDGALHSCRVSLNGARSLGDDPFAISQLIRIACVHQTYLGIERTLAQGEPPLKELAGLQAMLEQEDAFDDLLLMARGERAIDHTVFEAVESGDVPIAELTDGRPGLQDRLLAPILRYNSRVEHPVMLRMMSRWVAIAQLPPQEQVEDEHQFEAAIQVLPKSALLSRLLLPHLAKLGVASRRKHALLRCTIAALAAERHRRESKDWPDSIDKLCPKYLAAVPLDPFDGLSLRYRRRDDGVMIYSVGKDGIDDGGNLDRRHTDQPGVDLGCRLWDVAKRRQPPRPKPPPPADPPGMPAPAPNPG